MILRETSRPRLLWDAWIAALVLVSATLIPFQIAFQHVAVRGGSTLVYLIDVFFLVDIAFNFFTSYRQGGSEVLETRRTVSHYVRTLLAIDLLANVPFDAVALLFSGSLGAAMSPVLLLRLLRLLRVVRLFAIVRRWQEQSWSNSGFLRIGKFLLVAALLMHWVACAWFLGAYLDGFPPDSWAAMAGIAAATPATQYLRSLYWAVVTMTTVGYGDITPHRTIEYVITIVVMLLGATLYAYIIGNLASLFARIDATKAAFWNRFEALSQFLRSRDVPHALNEQVRNYFEYVWERHHGMREDTLLRDLPTPLRLDVMHHLTRDLLAGVPLFRHCSPTLRNALLMALQSETFAPGGLIVREGEVGRAIYFISSGRVEIITGDGVVPHGTLGDGDYFGDLSLVLGERRTASVRATTYCEIFILTAESFERVKAEYPEFREALRRMSAERTATISSLVLDGIVL